MTKTNKESEEVRRKKRNIPLEYYTWALPFVLGFFFVFTFWITVCRYQSLFNISCDCQCLLFYLLYLFAGRTTKFVVLLKSVVHTTFFDLSVLETFIFFVVFFVNRLILTCIIVSWIWQSGQVPQCPVHTKPNSPYLAFSIWLLLLFEVNDIKWECSFSSNALLSLFVFAIHLLVEWRHNDDR